MIVINNKNYLPVAVATVQKKLMRYRYSQLVDDRCIREIQVKCSKCYTNATKCHIQLKKCMIYINFRINFTISVILAHLLLSDITYCNCSYILDMSLNFSTNGINIKLADSNLSYYNYKCFSSKTCSFK